MLNSETDAKGRKLEVIKVPCPPVQTRTQEEWETLVGGLRWGRAGGLWASCQRGRGGGLGSGAARHTLALPQLQ